MTLSKDWFESSIAHYTNKKQYAKGAEYFKIEGIIEGLQLSLEQQRKAPVPGPAKKKEINCDKGYAAIVKYYMDKKGYTIQKANEIAMKTIKDQQQQRITQ